MEELKVTHIKNKRKEEKGLGQGGTFVLDGTVPPCQIAAWTCLKALTCTVWERLVSRSESGAIGLALDLNMSGNGCSKED